MRVAAAGEIRESCAPIPPTSPGLREWAHGNPEARDALVPVVGPHPASAGGALPARWPHAHTLASTALVNEAYIRLIDDSPSDWNSRDHFYGVAAHLMRQVLVDHARRGLSQKRAAER